MNRRTTILTACAAILITLGLPGLASAQSNDPWWGRDRDRRDDDYYRRDRRDDGYYGNSRYDSRAVRDVTRRLKDHSKDFERNVDRFLDRSRVDGTRREDQINSQVHDFRHAAERLDDRVGNGRDLNRSVNEAREVLSRADNIGRQLSRLRADSRVYSDWSNLQSDLRLVADIYGLRYNGYDDGYYRRGSYDPRYPDDRNNRDRNRRNNNNDWWRRLPGVRWP